MRFLLVALLAVPAFAADPPVSPAAAEVLALEHKIEDAATSPTSIAFSPAISASFMAVLICRFDSLRHRERLAPPRSPADLPGTGVGIFISIRATELS